MPTYEYSHHYERSEADWYIDPPFCSKLLFDKVKFDGWIHDPACGSGNIIRMAAAAGYHISWSDKHYRGFGTRSEEWIDFLQDKTRRYNIVTNPPYNLCEEFFHHAYKHVDNKVALLTRLAFLEGQKRYKTLFKPFPPADVLVFSTRPSMPPPGVAAGGGKMAYCWIVWDKQFYQQHTHLHWLLWE